MLRIVFLHFPHELPAPQRSATCRVLVAPSSTMASICLLVTAKQMQTYISGGRQRRESVVGRHRRAGRPHCALVAHEPTVKQVDQLLVMLAIVAQDVRLQFRVALLPTGRPVT